MNAEPRDGDLLPGLEAFDQLATMVVLDWIATWAIVALTSARRSAGALDDVGCDDSAVLVRLGETVGALGARAAEQLLSAVVHLGLQGHAVNGKHGGLFPGVVVLWLPQCRPSAGDSLHSARLR